MSAEKRVYEYIDLISSRPVSPFLLAYIEEQIYESVLIHYFNNYYLFIFAPSTFTKYISGSSKYFQLCGSLEATNFHPITGSRLVFIVC
jgi:hypothetical protein